MTIRQLAENYIQILEEIIEEYQNRGCDYSTEKSILEQMRKENTMKTTITEKMIDDVLEIIKAEFTGCELANLNDEYKQLENTTTKIKGVIYPLNQGEALDDIADDYGLIIADVIRAITIGNYDSDDDCCWYDEETEKINSMTFGSDYFKYVDERDFAKFVIEKRDKLEGYCVGDETAERIREIVSAENSVEPEAPTENLMFTDRELNIIADSILASVKDCTRAGSLISVDADEVHASIEKYQEELIQLHNKICDMMN